MNPMHPISSKPRIRTAKVIPRFFQIGVAVPTVFALLVVHFSLSTWENAIQLPWQHQLKLAAIKSSFYSVIRFRPGKHFGRGFLHAALAANHCCSPASGRTSAQSMWLDIVLPVFWQSLSSKLRRAPRKIELQMIEIRADFCFASQNHPLGPGLATKIQRLPKIQSKWELAELLTTMPC